MSFFTIGRKLGIPETTAKTHFWRAKRLLRAALSEEGIKTFMEGAAREGARAAREIVNVYT